jgi:hypothetical protein
MPQILGYRKQTLQNIEMEQNSKLLLINEYEKLQISKVFKVYPES